MPLPVGDGGITPLHLLADHHQGPLGGGQHEQGLTLEKRDIKTLDLFMEGGPHINSQDEDGNTALHYAASQGRLDFVTALINQDARKDIPNRHGDIPRDLLPNGMTCEALVIIKQEPAEV